MEIATYLIIAMVVSGIATLCLKKKNWIDEKFNVDDAMTLGLIGLAWPLSLSMGLLFGLLCMLGKIGYCFVGLLEDKPKPRDDEFF